MEEWRDVKGYEGLYQVSNMGNVRSIIKGILNLKKYENNSGYLYVVLYKNKTRRKFYIHRLVAEEFIDNPNSNLYVDHIDTIKTNNEYSNLRWVTPSENNLNEITRKHISKSLKKNSSFIGVRGKKHPRSRSIICITTGEVFDCIEDACNKYGLNHSHVCGCCKGERKSHGKLPDGTKLRWKYK